MRKYGRHVKIFALCEFYFRDLNVSFCVMALEAWWIFKRRVLIANVSGRIFILEAHFVQIADRLVEIQQACPKFSGIFEFTRMSISFSETCAPCCIHFGTLST